MFGSGPDQLSGYCQQVPTMFSCANVSSLCRGRFQCTASARHDLSLPDRLSVCRTGSASAGQAQRVVEIADFGEPYWRNLLANLIGEPYWRIPGEGLQGVREPTNRVNSPLTVATMLVGYTVEAFGRSGIDRPQGSNQITHRLKTLTGAFL